MPLGDYARALGPSERSDLLLPAALTNDLQIRLVLARTYSGLMLEEGQRVRRDVLVEVIEPAPVEAMIRWVTACCNFEVTAGVVCS